MSKYTPGPWEARRAAARDLGPWEDYTAITLPGFGGLTPIALVPTHARAHTAQERDANAHLIAAAPDLLEALRLARTYVSPALQPTVYAAMDAAIAKATS